MWMMDTYSILSLAILIILKTGLENTPSNLFKKYHLKSPYNIHTAQKINFWYKTYTLNENFGL
jgi:hypothetical protein